MPKQLNVSTVTSLSSILLADDIGQVYGKILRALGNRRFECRCSDRVTRVVTIRGTFKKRKRNTHRDTFVRVGMWVLVSVREDLNKGEKGDIIHMYSESEVSVLKRNKVILDIDDVSEYEDVTFTHDLHEDVFDRTSMDDEESVKQDVIVWDDSDTVDFIRHGKDEHVDLDLI